MGRTRISPRDLRGAERFTMSASKKRFAFIATATAAVLVGSGIAMAFWTTTGSGNGTADVGSDTPVTVTQTNSVSGLVPGGPAADLDINVASTADGPQTINNVQVAISSITGNPGTCTAGDFTVVDPNLGGAQVIPAHGNVDFDAVDTGASVQMINAAYDQNGCKGATLHFTYSVN